MILIVNVCCSTKCIFNCNQNICTHKLIIWSVDAVAYLHPNAIVKVFRFAMGIAMHTITEFRLNSTNISANIPSIHIQFPKFRNSKNTKQFHSALGFVCLIRWSKYCTGFNIKNQCDVHNVWDFEWTMNFVCIYRLEILCNIKSNLWFIWRIQWYWCRRWRSNRLHMCIHRSSCIYVYCVEHYPLIA